MPGRAKSGKGLRLTREPTPAERSGRPWNVTILRAVCADGSVLWPEHTSIESYRNTYQSGGGPLFQATYMQDPSGLAGAVFRPEWFQSFCHPVYTERQPSSVHPGRWVTLTAEDLLGEGLVQAILPDMRTILSLQACDLALKQKETSDYYARANAYASRQGDFFVEDVFQARLTETEMVADMVRAGRNLKAKAIGIESVSFQALVFRQATRAAHLPFVELDPAGRDKVIRARPLAARYQAGKVYHRHGARWRQALEFQLQAFPGGAHDDMVDSLAYVYEMSANWMPGAYAQLTQDQEQLRRDAARRSGVVSSSSSGWSIR